MSHRIAECGERRVRMGRDRLTTEKTPCPSRYMQYPMRGRRGANDRSKNHRRK